MRAALWLAGFVGLAAFFGACAPDEEVEDSPEVTYCDVVPVLESRCRRCHGEPQENGAPMSLATLDAIHAEYPRGGGRGAFEMMQVMVEDGWMPPVDLETHDGKGPVEALSEEQRALLLAWLEDGAPRGDCSTP